MDSNVFITIFGEIDVLRSFTDIKSKIKLVRLSCKGASELDEFSSRLCLVVLSTVGLSPFALFDSLVSNSRRTVLIRFKYSTNRGIPARPCKDDVMKQSFPRLIKPTVVYFPILCLESPKTSALRLGAMAYREAAIIKPHETFLISEVGDSVTFFIQDILCL
ncbi:EC1118_1P2_2300p [Saccharomyces cerevisiae EC1118]|uniref:Uncharacterized protein YPL073C n=3 Tax=Saccharomyces cerevisiae TaxID=4932 RepID=YP073_YEAST|nr:RecName: Full=Uncharacterized protein YPL073C [Saccharomyces cerevisiae S288C]AAB68269.1 Ypl073cp [Saccharomyces cerevisiae]EDZ68854.1 hypothetical protein AWRI1631_161950 [Saccharomyces cerevisiae AWRI1631]CAY86888.1 EC1118_1P2_2300p [Saccharomyces cerevisiae EC1118]